MSEGLWKLPKDWTWVELEQIADVYGGGTPKREQPAFFDGGVVWITPSDLTNELPVPTVSDSATKLTSEGLASSSARLLPKGTVLFSSRATIGKIAIAALPLATNQGFANFVCRDRLDNRYLAYVLRKFTPEIERLAGSTTYREVSKSVLKKFRIPFPPREEQQRIVAKIEALFDRIREAKGLRGPARADVSQLIQASEQEVFNGLRTVHFGQLVSSYKNGIYKPMQFYGRGYPSLRMFNIRKGKVNLDAAPFLQVTPEELNTYGLKPDDILVVRVNGSREIIGIAGLVPSGLGPCTFESKTIRIRIQREVADPAFVVTSINSETVRRQFTQKLRTSAGQFTINQDDLNRLEVPFISDLGEQRRIVGYLDAVKQTCLRLSERQEQTDAELKQLEQTILDQAFRGDL